MKQLTDQLEQANQETGIEKLQLEVIKLNGLLYKCFAILKENHDRVYTDKQLAERYNVHTATVREWRKKGLKSRVEGKTIFILESDFIEWVAGEKF